jgi:hypothetical protein
MVAYCVNHGGTQKYTARAQCVGFNATAGGIYANH